MLKKRKEQKTSDLRPALVIWSLCNQPADQVFRKKNIPEQSQNPVQIHGFL